MSMGAGWRNTMRIWESRAGKTHPMKMSRPTLARVRPGRCLGLRGPKRDGRKLVLAQRYLRLNMS